MVSNERVEQIADYVKTHDIQQAVNEFNLKLSSIERYLRWFKNNIKGISEVKQPKILIFDIETSPNIGAFWSPWKTNINHSQLLRGWHLLMWAAKWFGDKDVLSDRLTGDEAIAGNDKRIAKSLRDLIDEADVIIAHNGKRFDVKKINARLIINNIPQPSPYRVIDTLIEVKKKFTHTYNNLDYLVNILTESDGKTGTNMQLWLDCIKGDEAALKKMDDYCQNDVYILEELYVAIRGWISPSVNMSVYYDANEMRCSHCGSTDIDNTGKFKVTQVGKYEVFKCNSCGNFSTSRKNSLTTDKREWLLTNYK